LIRKYSSRITKEKVSFSGLFLFQGRMVEGGGILWASGCFFKGN
jgi:hypothetical protein